MTWSITRSKIVGGDAIVRWNEQPLRQLSDGDFLAATEAANALGDDVVKQVAQNPNGGVSMVGEAGLIVMAVMKEMERRGPVVEKITPGFCADCGHVQGDHCSAGPDGEHETMCIERGCGCEQFAFPAANDDGRGDAA